jgi:hypothetical protein
MRLPNRHHHQQVQHFRHQEQHHQAASYIILFFHRSFAPAFVVLPTVSWPSSGTPPTTKFRTHSFACFDNNNGAGTNCHLPRVFCPLPPKICPLSTSARDKWLQRLRWNTRQTLQSRAYRDRPLTSSGWLMCSRRCAFVYHVAANSVLSCMKVLT